MPEVTAIEVERVRPEVPPRPECWAVLQKDDDRWWACFVNDAYLKKNAEARYCDPDTQDAVIIRIPSEAECDYRKKRGELLELAIARTRSAVAWCEVMDVVHAIDALDAEWSKVNAVSGKEGP